MEKTAGMYLGKCRNKKIKNNKIKRSKRHLKARRVQHIFRVDLQFVHQLWFEKMMKIKTCMGYGNQEISHLRGNIVY